MHEGSIEGRSLSFCIRDIAEGKVAEFDVARIVTGTCAPDRAAFEALLDGYCETYWRKMPETAKAVALRLFDAGKIDQPRLRGEEGPNVSNGHWKVDEAEGPLENWGGLGIHDPGLIRGPAIQSKAKADAAALVEDIKEGVAVSPSRRLTLKIPRA